MLIERSEKGSVLSERMGVVRSGKKVPKIIPNPPIKDICPRSRYILVY